MHEVAAFGRFVARDGFERRAFVIEMIDQAFARVAVVSDVTVQAFLFEHHAVVDAGHLLSVAGPVSCQDLAMVGLGAASERCQQVEADRAHIEFVEMAATGRGDEADQFVVDQPDFLAGVEVVVVHRRFDPRVPSCRSPPAADCRRQSGGCRRRGAGGADRCHRTPRASSCSCTGRGTARGARIQTSLRPTPRAPRARGGG